MIFFIKLWDLFIQELGRAMVSSRTPVFLALCGPAFSLQHEKIYVLQRLFSIYKYVPDSNIEERLEEISLDAKEKQYEPNLK